VLLDVRESNEYERSHAAFATLAPLSMLKRLIFPESRDSGKQILVVAAKNFLHNI
jgi:rhodanese-related sulfurtransferase